MALYNGIAYVTLGNYDATYAVRGPGLLAAVVPSTGKVTVIDLGGSDEKQCKEAGFVRHDPPLEAWLDGFLHHWLEQDVIRPKAAKACAAERDASVATGL